VTAAVVVVVVVVVVAGAVVAVAYLCISFMEGRFILLFLTPKFRNDSATFVEIETKNL
jgi:hypothetical protein